MCSAQPYSNIDLWLNNLRLQLIHLKMNLSTPPKLFFFPLPVLLYVSLAALTHGCPAHHFVVVPSKVWASCQTEKEHLYSRLLGKHVHQQLAGATATRTLASACQLQPAPLYATHTHWV